MATVLLLGACSSTDELVEALDRIAWKLEDGWAWIVEAVVNAEPDRGAIVIDAPDRSAEVTPILEIEGISVTVVEPTAIEPEAPALAAANRIDRDFSTLDEVVRALPRAESIGETVSQLAGIAGDEWEQARAVYVWLTDNIAYDAAAFFSGGGTVTDPEGVFRTGRSVCQGYAELFRVLGSGLGLEVALVSGYSKGYGYSAGRTFSKTNHAWNAVRVDGAWHLFDSTWGSGYVDGRRFVRKYGEFWFDPHPELYLRTHLPQNVDWQLISEPIDMEEYLNQPFVESYVYENLCALGFDDADVLAALTAGAGLPSAYSYRGQEITILQAPLREVLPAGEPIEIRIRVPGGSEGAIINNRGWTYMVQDGTDLTATVSPSVAKFQVAFRRSGSRSDSYSVVLEYEVR